MADCSGVGASRLDSKYLIHSFRDTVCWIQSETKLYCKSSDQTVNSEFSVSVSEPGSGANFNPLTKIVDPFIVGNESAIGVGFRDLMGNIYYGSFNTNEVVLFSFSSQVTRFQSLSDFKTDNYLISFDISVLGEILFKSQSLREDILLGAPTRVLTPFFAFLGDSASNFSWGRDPYQNTWSCVLDINDSTFASCSFNDPSNFSSAVAVSFTNLQSVTQLLYPPTLDRTCGLYITQEMQGATLVNGVVKFLGVPYCYNGSATGSCSFASFPTVENIPPNLQSVTQVSLGAWGACAVAAESLSCWGAYVNSFQTDAFLLWNGYKSVTGVSVYDSGACVQYISNGQPMGSCWGPLSLTGNFSFTSQPVFYSQTVQPQFSCQSEGNLVYENLCYGCTYGQILDTSIGQGGSFPCLDCFSLSGGLPSARGPNDTVCQPCSLGSTTSFNKEVCEACPLNAFRTFLSDGITPMPACEECRPGFQASGNFQSCVQCAPGTARYATSISCEPCPFGSTPSTDQGSCISCPQPQILVGSLPDIICLPCPLGQHALEGICALCPTPLFRSDTMFDCAPCPEGTQPSADFTYCLPCPPNTVRKDTSKCYFCPSGTHPSEDRTQCIPNSKDLLKFFLSPAKTAAISTGLLVVSACAILTSFKKLTMGESLLGYTVGFLIMSGAFLV